MTRRKKPSFATGTSKTRVEHAGAAGILSSAGAGVLSIAAGLVLLPVIISTVGSGPYGLWLLISAITLYLQYADIGVGSAIVHFGSRTRAGAEGASFGEYVSAGLVWNLVVAAPVIPSFAFIATALTQENAQAAGVSEGDAAFLVIIGTVMLGWLLVSPFASALIGAGLLPVERRNQSIGVVIRCAGTLLACFVFDSIVFLAAAEAFAVMLPHALACITLIRRRLLRLRLSRQTWLTLRKMLGYSIRSFGVALVGATILQLGTVVVGTTLGPAEVTYYNAAYRVYTAARQLLTWVIDPFRSTLSREFVHDRDRGLRVLTTLCSASLACAMLGAGVLIFGSSQIVELWLGDFVPTTEVAVALTIFLLGYVINSIQIPLVPAGDAIGRPGAYFPIQLLWLALCAALIWPLTNIAGIAGASLALSAPLLLVGPLYLWRARAILRLNAADWRESGIWTFVVIGSVSTAAALAGSMILNALGQDPFSSLTSAVFAMVFIVLSLAYRRSLRPQQFAELLRAKL